MTEPTLARRRAISPLLLMILVPMLMLALLVGVLMVAQKYVTPQGLSEYEYEMADGTILKIEALTVPPSHNLVYETPAMGFSLLPGMRSRRLSHYSGGNQVVVWMSRRHAKSGQPIDLDFWYDNVVIDAADEEISDYSDQNSQATLHQFSEHGYSNGGQSERPFKFDHGSYSAWVIASALPPFRPKGDRLHLKVKNADKKVVAEFNLPHPAPTAFPVWTADTLPKTFTNGDLEVTVKEIQSGGHEYKSNNRIVTNYWANATTDFKWKGMPTTEWQQWTSFYSPLGTHMGSHSEDPTKREKVWKMTLTCSKTEKATFETSERGTLDKIELLEAEKTANSGKTTTINGCKIEVLTIGGKGPTSFEQSSTRLGYGSGHYTSSTNNYAFNQNISWRFEARGGTNAKVTCESPFPWVMIDRSTGGSNSVFYVSVLDDQGREVKSQLQHMQNNLSIIYMQPEADVKSVKLDMKIHVPMVFEAYVEVPEPKVQKNQ